MPTEADVAGRIEDTLSFAPWLICEIEGVVAGYTYARRFKERAAYRWAVELSTYLAEGYREKRIGRALVSSRGVESSRICAGVWSHRIAEPGERPHV